jgi:hypothetical protein
MRPAVIDDLRGVVRLDPPLRFREGIAFVFGPAIGTKAVVIVNLSSAMMAEHRVLYWSGYDYPLTHRKINYPTLKEQFIGFIRLF